MKKHNPDSNWLSVLIPAYNCSNTIGRLLDSIIIQDDPDIEVIICDDHSTDNFMDQVVPYADKLNIKYFKTTPRDLHCPGNTRFDAWHHATGEWITFIDNDDMFEPGAFKRVKDEIETYNEERFVFTTFRDYIVEDDTYMQVFDGITWMHGKWYNRQWLIDEGIDFLFPKTKTMLLWIFCCKIFIMELTFTQNTSKLWKMYTSHFNLVSDICTC